MSTRLMPELEAITSAIDLLQPLSPDARSRVLAWLDDYFKHHETVADTSSAPAQTTSSATNDDAGDVDSLASFDTDETASISFEEPDAMEDTVDDIDYENDEETFDSFDQFYEYVAPKTARQKVATAGWWLEYEEGQSSWRTFDVTKALKGIGKPLRYLSTTITQEKKKDDPLIEQLSKDGDSAQAHGTFRLSEFGRAFVEGRLPEDYLSDQVSTAADSEEYSVEESGDLKESVDYSESEDLESQEDYVQF